MSMAGARWLILGFYRARVGAIYSMDYCEGTRKVKLYVWPEKQVLPEWCTSEIVVQIVQQPGEGVDGYCSDV